MNSKVKTFKTLALQSSSEEAPKEFPKYLIAIIIVGSFIFLLLLGCFIFSCCRVLKGKRNRISIYSADYNLPFKSIRKPDIVVTRVTNERTSASSTMSALDDSFFSRMSSGSKLSF